MLKTNCIMTKRRLGYFVNPLRTLCSQQHWFKPDGIDTGIRIYNCAARRQVPLILPNESFLTWYTCGPTVYDSSHLGHASCYVKLDIIQRILRQHFNFNIVSAMNITDIDDKIIKRSQESGKVWREISHYYETEFWSDLNKLNVIQPNIKLRVTEHMPKIINYIENIVRKQCAYVANDSSVYFDVKQFPIYGKLQNLNLNEDDALKSQNKLSPFDFALWKSRKSENEPSWPSPWGPGRPGWHIECSTLANMIFGKSIDIHAGGMDLRFPHHENEEAQSCVYHDTRQWVNYWLHTGHLNIKGESEKMSKSLKNTISIDEMLKEFTADDFRMACALSNYKNSMDYSKELMETAKNTLNKFKTFKFDCLAYLSGKKIGSNLNANTILQNLNYAKSNIDSCIRDDFDTAFGFSFNKHTLRSNFWNAIAAVNNYVDYILQSFGFSFADDQRSINSKENININVIIEDILKTRENIRQQAVMGKNKELFKVCDDLRNCLRNHGIEIRDHPQGSSWNFIENKN
ncbi:mitochondrial, Cysteine--tRNA ligase [Lucilia cuprina]|nr:mitochondrial, Cysteine--tRNA ligase [Lucilia cuprina]